MQRLIQRGHHWLINSGRLELLERSAMESLALVISILLLILLFSAPFALLFTIPRIRTASQSALWLYLRRFVMALSGAFGFTVSIFFLFARIPFGLRAVALISIALHLWAINREYGLFASFTKRGDANGPAGQR